MPEFCRFLLIHQTVSENSGLCRQCKTSVIFMILINAQLFLPYLFNTYFPSDISTAIYRVEIYTAFNREPNNIQIKPAMIKVVYTTLSALTASLSVIYRSVHR